MLEEKKKTAIQEYFQKEFGVFNRNFYESQLLALVNGYSDSVVSSRVDIELSTSYDYTATTIEFHNALQKGSIRSSQAIYGTLYDDGQGNIKATGSDSTFGTVDYDKGVITMTEQYGTTNNSTLEWFGTPVDDDVEAGLLSILLLNENRLQVNLESE